MRLCHTGILMRLKGVTMLFYEKSLKEGCCPHCGKNEDIEVDDICYTSQGITAYLICHTCVSTYYEEYEKTDIGE